MKLFEIIQTSVKVHTLPDIRRYSPMKDTNKKIGGGSFAVVMQNNDAHLVSKNSNSYISTLDIDPYFQYVHRIVDDKLYEQNPYFPRIYTIHIYVDKNLATKDKAKYKDRYGKIRRLYKIE